MKRRIFIYPILAYVTWCLFLYFLQDLMLFPGAGAHRPLGSIPSGVEQVWISGTNNVRIEGWFITGQARNSQHPGTAVVYMHGNGELIDDCLNYREIQQYLGLGISILLPEYRGYGRSQGKPSEKNISDDMVKFYEWLQMRPEVDRSRIIIHGRSLGGAVAAALASRKNPAALILESTFSSMIPFAHRYGIPGFLCRNPFRTDRILPRLACPIFISHGRNDRLIPVSHGRRLHRVALQSEYVETATGHNDRPQNWNEYWGKIVAFVRKNKLL